MLKAQPMQDIRVGRCFDLTSCVVVTRDTSLPPPGTTGRLVVMVVTDGPLAINWLSTARAMSEGPSFRPDLIVWPGDMVSSVEPIPLDLRARSVFDTDGEIIRQFPTSQPWAFWLCDMLDQGNSGQASGSTLPRHQRADQTIDLGDVLR
jgi:hypothetical protein